MCAQSYLCLGNENQCLSFCIANHLVIYFIKCCDEIAGALKEMCNRLCKREHVEYNALNTWKLLFLLSIKDFQLNELI